MSRISAGAGYPHSGSKAAIRGDAGQWQSWVDRGHSTKAKIHGIQITQRSRSRRIWKPSFGFDGSGAINVHPWPSGSIV